MNIKSLTKSKFGRRLTFLTKILVTLILYTILLWKGDWQNIWKALLNSDPFLIFCVLICTLFCVTISTFKWKILLSIHGIHFDFLKLHRYYFTAIFFNNFLPTNIGGDSYRIYKTLQNTHSKAGSVIAVFTERITGMWALLVFGLTGGIVIFFNETDSIPQLGVILIIFGVFVVIPIIFLIFSRSSVTWLLSRKNFPRKISKILEHFGDYRRQPSKTVQIILISIAFHLFTFFWMLLLIHAIGSTCSFFDLVVAITISNLVAMLPFSINGIGLMDGSFIYVMGKFGMNYESALTFMLLYRAILILVSMIGGLFYFKDKHLLKIDDLQGASIQSLEESTL